MEITERTCDKIRTAWNVAQRKVWRLPNVAHSKLLPLLAMNDNMLTQVMKRSQKFITKTLLGSDNPVVKSLYELSLGNTHSVIGTNTAFLDSMDSTIPADDDSVRVAAQIIELNSCLDGVSDCGLDRNQVQDILNYISVI